MRSLPSGSWIDLEFAEAACKRIAELEAENGKLATGQGWLNECVNSDTKRIAELEAENEKLAIGQGATQIYNDLLDAVESDSGGPKTRKAMIREHGAEMTDGIYTDAAFMRGCKRIAELEAENKQIRERLEFFEDDEYRQPGMESIQERYRGASDE
jgi:hypothetical protein